MKKLLMTIVVMASVSELSAQDFAPSQQAQGYLDSKNVTVDHATGLFHYKVPIYTLKSEDFELPISLNYVGKGVRTDDNPGLIGYNWTLNTGGIVTRTIRGGIADETYNKGYIYQAFSDQSTTYEVKRVNKREIDGESDIFTAVFNGQSVSFIIAFGDNGNIIAEPLERTNVRIEIEEAFREITGWIVTDENGNKFYYRQREWSADIVAEDAVSFNGVRGETYTSSWYLSRIEPRNCRPIIFNYKADVNPYIDKQENIITTIYQNYYTATYHYGRPMYRYPANNSRYIADFDENINNAMWYLNWASISIAAETAFLISKLNIFKSNDVVSIYLNDYSVIDDLKEALNDYQQIMGVSSVNIEDMGGTVIMIIDNLEQLINFCRNSSDNNIGMATSFLQNARSALIQALNTGEWISSNEVMSGSAMKIKSPLLESIVCGDINLGFTYYHFEIFSQIRYRLGRIDLNGNQIANLHNQEDMAFPTRIECLRRLRLWYDIMGTLDFEYYEQGDANDPKTKILSMIRSVDDGEIHIDYEPNVTYSGIRIKSLVMEDPFTNSVDSIKYHYTTQQGETVFNELSTETVYYGGFSDWVNYSTPKIKSNAVVNTGNEGVHYPCVEEEFVGSGKKRYMFFYRGLAGPGIVEECRQWLSGLPLEVATYDKEGNLKHITRNKYFLNVDSYELAEGVNPHPYSDAYMEAWFALGDHSVRYSKSKPQIRAYEYYMDRDEIESYFRRQEQHSYLPYFHYSPYNSIYLNNYEPRMNAVLPEQRWNLIYGGKVLLKSQEEYWIGDNDSSNNSPLEQFFASDYGEPFRRIEYFYDNIENSSMPTRIKTTDSKGDSHTSVIRRVVDMNVSGILADMKSQNILSPIVKQQVMKGHDNQLLKETVNVYGSSLSNGKKYFGVVGEKTYLPTSATTISSFPALDGVLFTKGEQNYTAEKEITYKNFEEGIYLPVTISEKGNLLTLHYNNRTTPTPIMEVRNYNNNYFSVLDMSPYRSQLVPDWHIEFFERAPILVRLLYDFMIHFYEQERLILTGQKSGWAQTMSNGQLYIMSNGFSMLLDEMRQLVAAMENGNYAALQTYIRNLFENDELMSALGDFYHYSYMSQIYNDRFLMAEIDAAISLLTDLNFADRIDPQSNTLLLPSIPSLTVSQVSNSGLKLYVKSRYTDKSVNYTITHSGGTTTGTVNLVSKSNTNVQTFDIDISGYSGVTSVKVEPSSYNYIDYLCLVPADCEFVAVDHNDRMMPVWRFDQTGVMERYEYDDAGRVTKVWDGEGRLLKENTYHVN